MTIYITGDTHGEITSRLGVKHFREQKEMTGKNYLIILGDFGVIWDKVQSSQEKNIIKWLDSKPWITLFIDGNHENFDRLYSKEFKVVNFCGGKAQKISKNVYHLLRGEIYIIENKKFFCFGGAASHDCDELLDPTETHWKRKRKICKQRNILFRVIGQDWWSHEQASEDEKEYAIKNLDKHNWECDYVLTHTPPASEVIKYSKKIKENYDPDDTSLFLENIKKKLTYTSWFSGHLHDNCKLGRKEYILYKNIIELNDDSK